LPECVKAHLATWNFNFFQGRTQILAFWGGLKERLEMGEGERGRESAGGRGGGGKGTVGEGGTLQNKNLPLHH